MTNSMEASTFDEEEKLMYRICCADRQEVNSDLHFSLDLELVFTVDNNSIGKKLLKQK